MAEGESLYRRSCLVVGAGATGCEVARCLARDSSGVSIWDEDATKRTAAEAALEGDGIHVLAPEELPSALEATQVLVGCTGRVWLHAEQILLLPRGCILVNASSKRLEIDWEDVAELSVGPQPESSAVARIELSNGNIVNVVANGMPVNFFDSESVNETDIQFIYGLLLAGAFLIAHGEYGPGIHPVPQLIQDALRTHMETDVWRGGM